MKDSRRRVFVLLAVYFGGCAVVLAHVAKTMLFEHEDWLRRSYGNRWAFRDVPTRRGSIRDRRGELLVSDHPTSALELHYRVFRRNHPCAAALFAANLHRAKAGLPARRFTAAHVREAFAHCMRLTFADLHDADRDYTRDLRFYVGALLGALTDTPRSRVARRLARLAKDGAEGPVIAALALDASALRDLFAERMREMHGVARLLRDAGGDLWAMLDDCEKGRLENERSEFVARELHGVLPYESARRIAQRGELHPGIRVGPSVARSRSSSAARWESLAPLLGRVTPEWGDLDDVARRRRELDEIAPELEAMAGADDSLSDSLQSTVSRRLRYAMEVHQMTHGRVGRHGVEGDLDGTLRGTAGLHWVVRDRRRRDLGLWSSFDVTPGDDVYLTVDLRLQHLLENAVDDALAGHSNVAAIAVVDPRSGDVLALASRPLPSHREPEDAAKLEPAISWWGAGAIGSLAKPLMLAEHLDAIRHGRPHRAPGTFEACTGRRKMQPDPAVPFKRHNLRCDHVHGSRIADPEYALSHSCNMFFYQVGEGLGWDGVKRAYRRFGLLCERDAEGRLPPASQAHVPGIPARTYPNPSWLESHDIQRRTIGYFVEANVLQMARAYAGLATGRLPDLSLVRRRPGGYRRVGLGLAEDDLAVVRRGMRECVETGTAAKLDLDGVWAKTGTAEVWTRTPTGARATRNNAWLAGFVGPEKLAFACVVYAVEEGSFGADAAGPMFAKFLRALRADPVLAKEYL